MIVSLVGAGAQAGAQERAAPCALPAAEREAVPSAQSLSVGAFELLRPRAPYDPDAPEEGTFFDGEVDLDGDGAAEKIVYTYAPNSQEGTYAFRLCVNGLEAGARGRDLSHRRGGRGALCRRRGGVCVCGRRRPQRRPGQLHLPLSRRRGGRLAAGGGHGRGLSQRNDRHRAQHLCRLRARKQAVYLVPPGGLCRGRGQFRGRAMARHRPAASPRCRASCTRWGRA